MKEVLYNYDNLKENEIEGNYTIKMININDVENILIDSIPLNDENKIIMEEMLDVINEYKKIYNQA